MQQPRENYFIAHYEEPKQIPAEFSFVFDTKIEDKHITHFNISHEKCSELFIEDINEKLFKFMPPKANEDISYTKVSFILDTTQKKDLISTEMFNNTIILHYKKSIKIVDLDESSEIQIDINAQKILVTSMHIFAYEKSTQYIWQYNLQGKTINKKKIENTFVDMSYQENLYVLTKDNLSYHINSFSFPNLIKELDIKYLKALDENTQITQFAMLDDDHFIVHLEEGGLYYIDNINHTEELFFDKEISAFEIDCKGRVWILSANSLYRFYQDIRYKKPFDFYEKFYSFEDDTSWHSLIIDADIPQGTRMEIILDAEYGPTLPHIDSKHFAEETRHYINEKNILLYQEIGKRLLIKVSLFSDSLQESTPTIRSIKVLFNKSSYLEYLPAYYSQDSESLYRYLAIFQTIMDETSSTIDTLTDLLDISSTSDEFLSWLSQWLGLVRDYRWTEEKWREFLQRAPELYKKIGTKDGLSEIIELYSGKVPEIEEYLDNSAKRKENPFFFCVTIDADFSELEVAVITSIVDEFKPAYTQAKIVLNNNLIDNPNLILNESVLEYNSEIK